MVSRASGKTIDSISSSSRTSSSANCVDTHVWFGLQCPSPVQVAVMISLGNKPSSQVKVMDDPSNVVV